MVSCWIIWQSAHSSIIYSYNFSYYKRSVFITNTGFESVYISSFHFADIHNILDNRELSLKFEDFMLRRVLFMDPDTRWCPAPDCGYAVIASGCASCPKLKCERPGCPSYFCYHCKAEWHPNQTCDMARTQRGPHFTYSSSSAHNGAATSRIASSITHCFIHNSLPRP